MFSFAQRKSQNEIEGVLRRIVDRTTPNLAPLDGEGRYQNRHNRTLPILLTPRAGEGWDFEHSITGLTKDISDHGLCVVINQPVVDHTVAATLWLSARNAADATPTALQGRCRHCQEIGGGFWQVGVEINERLEDAALLQQILPLAWRLLPASAQADLLGPE